MASERVAEFYDGLADRYHLLFGDWWEAAEWHGEIVGALLAAEGISPGASVLDCTCGIGTQAIPLARQGYRVTASDISAAAIDVARVEADRREIELELKVADVRTLGREIHGTFDAVISCDNALPHLLTESDLTAAATSIRERLEADGVFVASIRDYDALAQERAPGFPPTVSGEPGHRRAVTQSWTWSDDGPTVDIVLYVLNEEGARWNVTVHEATYRAWSRAEFTSILEATGFDRVRWLMPGESGYYQPVVIARAAR